ncbi:MAG TPA: protein kinase, partial [Nitrososphaeraceae archaeon]|nr:protein kinase [Nitrososphaeraceae archaeon]
MLISSKWGGIEQCYGLTKDNSSNKYMLVMAKCGYSLESYLENEGTNLDFLERLKIIFEIIKGLFRIHSENFVHGKINTENVLYLEHKNDWYLSLNAVDSSDSKKYDIYGFGLIVEKLFFM